MAKNDAQRPVRERPRRRIRDVPGCLKYVLLVLLLLLLAGEAATGEFSAIAEKGGLVWVILIIKLILIALLIALILVQRDLKCEITEPMGCATIEYDAAEDKWIIRVKGTASGAIFGGYTLSVEQGGSPFPMNVIYPGGAPSGVASVVAGELGQLDLTGVDPGAGFTVILTVSPAGAGSPKICTSNFEIQRKMVYTEKIGNVRARVVGAHPDDPSEALKLVKVNPDPPLPDPPGPEASVAESISVAGGADFYGCGRQMSEYVLQHREVAHPDNPWQQDAAGAWVDINAALPFGDANHPRTYSWIFGLLPNYVTNGTLTRHWVVRQILQALIPTAIYAPRDVTRELAWNTGSLNGRFTVRVRVRHQPLVGPPDPTPPEVYDSATVWLDNRQIDGKITGMSIAGGAALAACDELLLSQFVTSGGTKIDAEITGRAWDPLILDSYPDTLKPNDNFDYYRLSFKKDGGSFNDITAFPPGIITRVPNVLQASPLPPLPAGTGTLHSWDIVGALDAGPHPGGSPPDPDPKIYRGQRCAYLIELYVQDTTRRGDSATPHYKYDFWPFCIMNDLPNNLAFPVPAP